jgi:hypothetical protein
MAQEYVTPEMTEAYEQRRPSNVYNYAYEPTKTERFKAGLGAAGRGLYDYGVEPVFVRPTNWAKSQFAAKPGSANGAVAPAVVTPAVQNAPAAVQGSPATGYGSYMPSWESFKSAPGRLWSNVPSREQIKANLPSRQYLLTGVPEGHTYVEPAVVAPAVQGAPTTGGFWSYVPSRESVTSAPGRLKSWFGERFSGGPAPTPAALGQ